MATKEQADFYDNFIPHFEQQQNNGRNQLFRGWVHKWVRPNTYVLDLGCAFGYNSYFLAQPPFNCVVTGIDISPKCIEKAKSEHPNCHWYCGDITEGFEPDVLSAFDFILLSDVIEHIPLDRHVTVFSKLAEWSKPGAVILASVPNPAIYEQVKETTYQPVEERVEIPELMVRMRAAGFSKFVSIFLLDNTYYRMVVQRG